MYQQLKQPNLDITYTGGWCLLAVRQAFSIPIKYASAMQDWRNGNQHLEPPPNGVAVPIYFDIGSTPDGHVAISLGDGRIASSTLAGTHKGLYIHPSLNDLTRTYARYNKSCT